MSGSVNPARKTADHSQSRIGKLISQSLRRLHTVMCGASRADNADCMLIALFQLAPNVKHNWRRMNFPERLGIGRGFLRDDCRAKIANTSKLGGKINSRFPCADLICDFIADSVNLAKLAASRGEDLLRLLKNLQQFPQPHWPHSRQHIERDASLGRIHFVEALVPSACLLRSVLATS